MKLNAGLDLSTVVKLINLKKVLKIKDVRLVYAPPAYIGEYGGEIDNWMYPRHTGDFALLRAYVSKDGSSEEFNKDNVPILIRFIF